MSFMKKATDLPALKLSKLLVKLSQSKFFICACRQGDSAEEWRLFTMTKTGQRAVGVIQHKIINELLSTGALEICDNRARLTKAGQAMVKRLLYNQGDCFGQHQIVERKTITDGTGLKEVKINEAESPLAWLATRKDNSGKPMIEAHQVAAGERLRKDYERAQLAPQLTRNWDQFALAASKNRGGTYEGLALSELAMDAKSRVGDAIGAIAPELAGIVIDICCDQLGLVDAEKRNGLPPRSGKVILRMALNQLARHYGLLTDDTVHREVQRRITHWGDTDYKPAIEF